MIAIANTARENMFCAIHIVSVAIGGVAKPHPAEAPALLVTASLPPDAIVCRWLLDAFSQPIWVSHVQHSMAQLLLTKFKVNVKISSLLIASSKVQHNTIAFIPSTDQDPWRVADTNSPVVIEMFFGKPLFKINVYL